MDKLTEIYSNLDDRASAICDYIDAATELVAVAFRARHMLQRAKRLTAVYTFDDEVEDACSAFCKAQTRAYHEGMKCGKFDDLDREATEAYLAYQRAAHDKASQLFDEIEAANA